MNKLLLAISPFLLLVPPLAAHHSFGAEYDGNKPVTLTGVVTKIEWTNPHCHFYMDVAGPSSVVASWKFEGYPPSVLFRTGWKRDVTMKLGDTVTVFGWRARDGTNWAHAREFTFQGRQAFVFGPRGGHWRWRRHTGGRWKMMCQALAASVALCLALTSACAQKGPSPADVPRTADGKPDLSGVWQSNHTIRGTWEQANPGPGQDAGIPTVNSALVSEPAPYKPDAAKKVLESFNRRAIDDPTAICLSPGVPRVHSVALFPLEIVQTPQKITILYEWFHVYRIIPLNAKHPDDVDQTFMGDSVGHWEGDTLVTDVIGFNDKTWLIGAGTFHTEALHVTERFTRLDKDTIRYEATMQDPNVLTKPWHYNISMMRRDGTRIREYECDEHNVDPERYEKLLKDESVFRRR